MRVGVVPTKAGYSAVCLPPYGNDWHITTPIMLSTDQLAQLRGQILHRLAEYCQLISQWRATLWVAIPWAAWGIAALALSALW
jgi:hypothetical protein